MRIPNESQIAQQVFDLRALVEAESAHHGVANVIDVYKRQILRSAHAGVLWHSRTKSSTALAQST